MIQAASEPTRARYPDQEGYACAAHVRDVIAALDAFGVESAMMISSSPRLDVFEGPGPVLNARWPVATNIASREFLESVRSGAVSVPTMAKP